MTTQISVTWRSLKIIRVWMEAATKSEFVLFMAYAIKTDTTIHSSTKACNPPNWSKLSNIIKCHKPQSIPVMIPFSQKGMAFKLSFKNPARHFPQRCRKPTLINRI